MKKQKIATVVTCCALVGAIAVGGTLALLSVQTSSLKNTFTVGEGYPGTDDDTALQLKEHAVEMVDDNNATTYENYKFGDYAKKSDEVIASSAQQKGNEYKDVIPGADLDKDPWFTLAANSPDSWIIAHVDGVEEVEGAGITIDSVLSDDKGAWYKVDVTMSADETTVESVSIGNTAAMSIVDGYYLYKAAADEDNGKVMKSESDTNTAPLFTRLSAGDTLKNGENLNITIKGVAVQATESMTLANSKVAVMQAVVDALE